MKADSCLFVFQRTEERVLCNNSFTLPIYASAYSSLLWFRPENHFAPWAVLLRGANNVRMPIYLFSHAPIRRIVPTWHIKKRSFSIIDGQYSTPTSLACASYHSFSALHFLLHSLLRELVSQPNLAILAVRFWIDYSAVYLSHRVTIDASTAYNDGLPLW